MSNITKESAYILHPVPPTSSKCPTHTRGMAEHGIPEFIIGRNVFGPGNMLLIAEACNYLAKPENAEILELILAGETVTINSKSLDLDGYGGVSNFFFRMVDADYKAVKIAYEDLDTETLAQMQFVEIYIEEEGFDLEDD